MTFALLAAMAMQAAPTPAPAQESVQLSRVMRKGEVYAYKVHGWMYSEQRQPGLDTFLPSEEGTDYDFTLAIAEEKADGIVRAIYRRPFMTIITGESFEAPERRQKVKSDWNLQLDVSPLNEILEVKDITPKPVKKPEKKPAQFLRSTTAFRSMHPTSQGIVNQYISDVYRLAMFVGDLDSGMDFNPKLPYSAIKPGKTWKKTVGYSPQRLKGSKASAVQRLDYIFTYVGVVESGTKKFHRVTAALNLDTDAGEYINQSMGMKPTDSGLKRFGLKLKALIEYDLDLKTCATVAARANSEGSATLELTTSTAAALELLMKGKSTLDLTSVKKAK